MPRLRRLQRRFPCSLDSRGRLSRRAAENAGQPGAFTSHPLTPSPSPSRTLALTLASPSSSPSPRGAGEAAARLPLSPSHTLTLIPTFLYRPSPSHPLHPHPHPSSSSPTLTLTYPHPLTLTHILRHPPSPSLVRPRCGQSDNSTQRASPHSWKASRGRRSPARRQDTVSHQSRRSD